MGLRPTKAAFCGAAILPWRPPSLLQWVGTALLWPVWIWQGSRITCIYLKPGELDNVKTVPESRSPREHSLQTTKQDTWCVTKFKAVSYLKIQTQHCDSNEPQIPDAGVADCCSSNLTQPAWLVVGHWQQWDGHLEAVHHAALPLV